MTSSTTSSLAFVARNYFSRRAAYGTLDGDGPLALTARRTMFTVLFSATAAIVMLRVLADAATLDQVVPPVREY